MTRWIGILGVFTLIGMVVLSAGATEGVGALFSVGLSGRALGMGGAFMALADDEGAVLNSPAALGWSDTIGILSMLAGGFGGTTHGAVAVSMPYVGFGAILLDSGAIPTDGGSFRYASQGFIASLGVPIGPVALGVRGRLLRVSAPTSGIGWAIDPEVVVAIGAIRVALMYESVVSGRVEYTTRAAEAWERSIRLGASATLLPTDNVLWSVAFEAGGLFSALPELTGGVEAWIGGLGARAGFDGRGPTFGLSVRFASLQFDWAYAMRDDLGDSHRVSFTYRF